MARSRGDVARLDQEDPGSGDLTQVQLPGRPAVTWLTTRGDREAAAAAEATPGDPAAEAQGDGQETVNGTAEPDSPAAVSLCARAAWGMPPLSARLGRHLALLLLRFVRQWVLISL